VQKTLGANIPENQRDPKTKGVSTLSRRERICLDHASRQYSPNLWFDSRFRWNNPLAVSTWTMRATGSRNSRAAISSMYATLLRGSSGPGLSPRRADRSIWGSDSLVRSVISAHRRMIHQGNRVQGAVRPDIRVNSSLAPMPENLGQITVLAKILRICELTPISRVGWPTAATQPRRAWSRRLPGINRNPTRPARRKDVIFAPRRLHDSC
jgi:hypothetical protein